MDMVEISGEDIATIIDSIIYYDDEGFEEALEMGYDGIEAFSEILRESGKTFTIKTYYRGK